MNDCKPHNSHKLHHTALSYHHFTDGHSFDFDNAMIIDMETNWKKRFLSETLNIKLNSNSINFKIDTQQLNIIYSGLLHKKDNGGLNTFVRTIYGFKFGIFIHMLVRCTWSLSYE